MRCRAVFVAAVGAALLALAAAAVADADAQQPAQALNRDADEVFAETFGQAAFSGADGGALRMEEE